MMLVRCVRPVPKKVIVRSGVGSVERRYVLIVGLSVLNARSGSAMIVR
jgi:hypothetical protein